MSDNVNKNDDNLLTEATVVSDQPQKIEPVDFKILMEQFLKQCSGLGQILWTSPEPSAANGKIEISIARVCSDGRKQKFRVTLEEPETLIF